MIYHQETHSIEVRVRPIYNRDHSAPKNHLYIWEYEITMINRGRITVQLLNRYWQIINAKGEQEEIHGPGVIGLQPTLRPGELFQYRSFTRLNTPSGKMTGHFEMVSSKEERLFIKIPVFNLFLPARLIEPSSISKDCSKPHPNPPL